MGEIVKAQGGDPRVLDDFSIMPGARYRRPVCSTAEGYVVQIDTEAVGWAAMLLGAGRTRLDSSIDLGVGVTVEAKLGDRVEAGSRLATLHYNEGSDVEAAAAQIETAYVIGRERVPPPPLILDVIDSRSSREGVKEIL
jgi:pyrimidine-nucleoside phosphorylase